MLTTTPPLKNGCSRYAFCTLMIFIFSYILICNHLFLSKLYLILKGIPFRTVAVILQVPDHVGVLVVLVSICFPSNFFCLHNFCCHSHRRIYCTAVRNITFLSTMKSIASNMYVILAQVLKTRKCLQRHFILYKNMKHYWLVVASFVVQSRCLPFCQTFLFSWEAWIKQKFFEAN